MQGLLFGKIEIMADILCPKHQRVLLRLRFVKVGDQLAVKQRPSQAVPQGSSRGQKRHHACLNLLMVDAHSTFVGGFEEKEVAFFEMEAHHLSSQSVAQEGCWKLKQTGDWFLSNIHWCRDHALQGMHRLLLHGKTLSHCFEKELSRLMVGHLMEVLHELDDHHVFLVPFEALVDLAARPEQLHTEFGQPLCFHLGPLSRELLKDIHQFVKPEQTAVHPRFGQLVSHVSRGV